MLEYPNTFTDQGIIKCIHSIQISWSRKLFRSLIVVRVLDFEAELLG